MSLQSKIQNMLQSRISVCILICILSGVNNHMQVYFQRPQTFSQYGNSLQMLIFGGFQPSVFSGAWDHNLQPMITLIIITFSGLALGCWDFKSHFHEFGNFVIIDLKKQHKMGLDMSSVSSLFTLFQVPFYWGTW